MPVFIDIDEMKKKLQSPSGLEMFGPYVLMSFLTHPDVKIKTFKDVSNLEDRFVFFVEEEAVFTLSIPWDTYNDVERTKVLTEKYGWLLKPNH